MKYKTNLFMVLDIEEGVEVARALAEAITHATNDMIAEEFIDDALVVFPEYYNEMVAFFPDEVVQDFEFELNTKH